MELTINQIQKLEKYISSSGENVDRVFANSISKLYKRELKRNGELILKLENQLDIFEKQYKLKTIDFIMKFESGLIGDEIDFIEWSATYDMLINARKKLEILQNK